jgi:RNA polymerase sigma-70 factor, ECF subfamily
LSTACAGQRAGSDARVQGAEERAIEAIWRLESPRIVAGLTRLVRDVGVAEQLAQDAFVAALEQWPTAGMPDNPGAWLMAVGKRRAVDLMRRQGVVKVGESEVEPAAPAAERTASDEPDDLLRLVFLCCHPVLPPETRAAMTLRLVCSLTTDEIARAFLVPEPTIAQRIVRGKRTLNEEQVAFEVPAGEQLAARLPSVLEVIYLLFNEGYSGTAGADLMRTELCEEALRLGRMLAELVPGEGEVHGLVALLELQSSRMATRTGPGGDPVLLFDQDRSRWDQLLITRGLTALARARAPGRAPGPYELQASIAACHARAATPGSTDWLQIVTLYGDLLRLHPSPVVELNRAVAVAMAFGPWAGLGLLEPLAEEPSLRSYHLLPAVRADLLFKLGRHAEARADFERAAALTDNARERSLLLQRAAACREGNGSGRG